MKKQFTLIELLAVITILGILMGLAGAGVPMVMNMANKMTCQNNMKNLGSAAEACSNQGGSQGARYPGGAVVNGKSWVARLALLNDSVVTNDKGEYIIPDNRKALGMFTCSSRDESYSIAADALSGPDENGVESLAIALSYIFNGGASDAGLANKYSNRDVVKSAVKAPATTAYLIETHGACDASISPDAAAESIALGINTDTLSYESPNIIYKKDPINMENKEFYKSRVITFKTKSQGQELDTITFDGRTNGARIHGREASPALHALMYDGSVEFFEESIRANMIKYRK